MNYLTSPAITELTTEDGPLNLLGEWLRGWFNGSLQQVGANGFTTFPAVNLAFGQSPAVQPMYQPTNGLDATIRVVLQPRQATSEALDTVLGSGRLETDRVLILFYVTAKHPGPGQSQQSAQTISNLLKAICTNPVSRYPLALGGIELGECQPPKTIASGDYAQRLVACNAKFLYMILFGTQPAPPAGGGAPVVVTGANWPQEILWIQSLALVQGEYLMGDFTCACNLALGIVTLTAFAPQIPVVLQLEVNGVLLGAVLTIPVGTANTEVNATVDLTVTNVSQGQKLRWKIISAPDAADSASRVTLRVVATPQSPPQGT